MFPGWMIGPDPKVISRFLLAASCVRATLRALWGRERAPAARWARTVVPRRELRASTNQDRPGLATVRGKYGRTHTHVD